MQQNPIGNVTCAPIGGNALFADILNLREIRRLLHLHKLEVKILGRCVDCMYFEAAEQNELALKDRFEAEKLPESEESRFRMAEIKNPKIQVSACPRQTGERNIWLAAQAHRQFPDECRHVVK